MTVESNFTRLQLLRLVIGLKNLAPVSSTIKKENQNQSRFAHAIFPALLANYGNWFSALFAPAVIGRSNYFGICFTTLS